MQASRFIERYGPWALIAGASEGIGEAFAHQLAARGLNLVLLARRQTPLEKLSETLQDQYSVNIRCVSVDLARPDLQGALAPHIKDLEIGLLVYNACHSAIGPYLDCDLTTKMQTVDVNCRGPLALTSLLAPPMVARGRGGIVLMSSTSGYQGAALLAVYAASKAFNTTLAEGLWEEMRGNGVDVLALVAGATRTPAFEDATPADKQESALPMAPEEVVRQGLARLGGRRPVFIAGRLNRVVVFTLSRLISRRAAVTFMGRQLRRIYIPSSRG